MGWGGRCGGIQDRGTQVYLWLVHVHVWSKPPEYCKVVSLQLNKLLKKKKKRAPKTLRKIWPKREYVTSLLCTSILCLDSWNLHFIYIMESGKVCPCTAGCHGDSSHIRLQENKGPTPSKREQTFWEHLPRRQQNLFCVLRWTRKGGLCGEKGKGKSL